MCLRKISVKHIKGLLFVSNLYNRIEGLCADKRINITTMCKESGASRASLTDLKMGRKQSLSADTLSKISVYFGVSVDYLLGNEPKEKTPAEADERTISDEDIMFALWGDTTDVDEDDLDDVKRYAAFVRERKKKK
nr:MAG TPA: Cro/C1-type HTH DNA-binding domain protein [Caudoviricetes sp.]